LRGRMTEEVKLRMGAID
jgi:two-component system, NtrC family, sensor kinase